MVSGPLVGIVSRYVAFADDGAPMARREMPTGGTTLILNLGQPMWTTTGGGGQATTLTSFVAGVHDRPTTVGHHGGVRGVQVELSAIGASVLFVLFGILLLVEGLRG